jgi:hypothetical protein
MRARLGSAVSVTADRLQVHLPVHLCPTCFALRELRLPVPTRLRYRTCLEATPWLRCSAVASGPHLQDLITYPWASRSGGSRTQSIEPLVPTRAAVRMSPMTAVALDRLIGHGPLPSISLPNGAVPVNPLPSIAPRVSIGRRSTGGRFT